MVNHYIMKSRPSYLGSSDMNRTKNKRGLTGVLALSLIVLAAITITTSIHEREVPGTLKAGPIAIPAGQGDFLSTWNTALTSGGSSNSSQISLPLESDGTYNFIVAWGDGSTDTITDWNQAIRNHTYVSPGVKNINITGTCRGWRFNNNGDRLKIIEISQWGSLRLGDSGGSFYGCTNLVLTATDAPDLTGTTTLSQAFRGCTNLGSSGNMSAWDVSGVMDMDNVFSDATSFNQDISDWNVSGVMDMMSMFDGATSFNQPIGSWNVSSVTTMGDMFRNAWSFNQPIGTWDVSGVMYMNNMFYYATAFDQPIGAWNVSSVTIMADMFDHTLTFNQPIGAWDVSGVTDMGFMFYGAAAFDQPIGTWKVSNVSDMDGMFLNARLSTANYDHLLLGWSQLTLRNGVPFHAGSSRFSSTANAARLIINSTYGWIITDGGQNEQPAITSPENVAYASGTTGHSISWTITDATTGTRTYMVYCDGAFASSGTWTSGSTITTSVDGLAVGAYNFTIIVSDGYGGLMQDVVFVSVSSPPPDVPGYPLAVLVACLLGACLAIVLVERRRGSVRTMFGQLAA